MNWWPGILKKIDGYRFCERSHLLVEDQRASDDPPVVRFSKTNGKKGCNRALSSFVWSDEWAGRTGMSLVIIA